MTHTELEAEVERIEKALCNSRLNHADVESTLRAEVERLTSERDLFERSWKAAQAEVERLKKRLLQERIEWNAEVERLKETNLKQSCHMAEKVDAFNARITELETQLTCLKFNTRKQRQRAEAWPGLVERIAEWEDANIIQENRIDELEGALENCANSKDWNERQAIARAALAQT